MTLKSITVTPYNPDWPHYFKVEAKQIETVLRDHCIALHHVGSTSVPELAAKPIIDIIGVVKNGKKAISCLETLGYIYKGEYNIPLRFYFTKKNPDIHLHVYEENHPEIALNLLFRDYLRTHPSSRNDYAQLKATLLEIPSSLEKNSSLFTGYTLGKNDFITQILYKAGFDQLRIVHCTHHAEWEAYHRIREAALFAPYNLVYDRHHPTLTEGNRFHFILYKGIILVAVAQIEWLENQEAALRSLVTDKIYQGQGFEHFFLQFLEQWLKHHQYPVIKLHAALSAVPFYRNRGYQEMVFNDRPSPYEVVDLGKYL